MSKIFIKYICSQESEYLAMRYPMASALLQIIVLRARRKEGYPDGLKPGECFIGDWKDWDMTEQQYRTAKKILVERGHIEIVETNRNRLCSNSTTGATTRGTKVRLISTKVYDLNINIVNDSINDRATTEQRRTKKEQERTESVDSAVYKSLAAIQDESLTQKEKERITTKYDEATVNAAVEAVLCPSHIPNVSLLKSLNVALRDGWKKMKPTNTNEEEKNKSLAKQLEEINYTYNFEASKECLIITWGSIHHEIKYKMSHQKFRETIEEKVKINLKEKNI